MTIKDIETSAKEAINVEKAFSTASKAALSAAHPSQYVLLVSLPPLPILSFRPLVPILSLLSLLARR